MNYENGSFHKGKEMRRFSLFLHKGIYYAQLFNPATGEFMTDRSTGKRNRDEAAGIVTDWLSNGLPKKKEMMTPDAILTGLRVLPLTPIEDTVMGKGSRFSPEVRERAVWLIDEKKKSKKPETKASLKRKLKTVLHKYIRIRAAYFEDGAWWVKCVIYGERIP